MPYTLFPLRPMTRDEQGVASCTCSEGPACRRAGKHPAVNYGDLPAGHSDYRGPQQGHAIATGIRSGIFVIDTDGPEAESAFVARAEGDDDPALDTYTVATPSGGKHRYYAWPGFPIRNSVGEYMPNVDVRGDGGFVVMAGSPHKSGRTYTVDKDIAPRAAPAWLLAWPGLKGRNTEASAGAPTAIDVTTPEGERRVRLGREACETYNAASDGTGGTPLMNLSLRLIRDLELPIDVAHHLIATVYNPRCTNDGGEAYPWDDREIDHKLTDARDKSDHVCGIGPEGWQDRLVASIRDHRRARAAEKTGRRRHDTSHKYAVLVGQNSCGEPAKTLPHQVRNHLWDHIAWDGVLAFDELRGEVVAVDPPTPLDAEKPHGGLSDEDGDRISNWFAVCEMPMAVLPDIAYRAAVVVAKRRSFNPIREYLEGLEVQHGAIEEMATEAMGCTDPIEIVYVRKFLIAAVRRALIPGTKVDTALTLFGERGLRKSSFVNALFTDAWSSDCVGNIEDEKGVGEKLAGKWCVELAELKSLQGASAETVLAFLSRRTDRFRGAYKRGNAKDYPRTCVFVGTTNETDILRNASGADARRFWICKPTRKIDTDWIRENRDAVWGEAYALAMTGELHWLTEEEDAVHYAHAEQFQAHGANHENVVEYLIGKTSVTPEEVFRALGGMSKDFDRKALIEITDTLRRIGCVRVVEGSRLRRVRRWAVPAELAKLSSIKCDPKNTDVITSLGSAIPFKPR